MNSRSSNCSQIPISPGTGDGDIVDVLPRIKYSGAREWVEIASKTVMKWNAGVVVEKCQKIACWGEFSASQKRTVEIELNRSKTRSPRFCRVSIRRSIAELALTRWTWGCRWAELTGNRDLEYWNELIELIELEKIGFSRGVAVSVRGQPQRWPRGREAVDTAVKLLMLPVRGYYQGCQAEDTSLYPRFWSRLALEMLETKEKD